MPLHDSVDMPVIPAAQAERERRLSEAKSELEKKVAEKMVEQNQLADEETPKQPMTTKNLFAKCGLLSIEAKNVTAKGYEVEDGFVVCKGSEAVAEETESLRVRFKNVMRIRKELIEQRILRRGLDGGVLIFTADHTFDSANIAANVVLGVACVALDRWKDEDGTTLKEIRQRKAGSA
jgi:hypothetical protein